MADILFAEQALDFTKDSNNDIFGANTGDTVVELTTGNEYTVIWDGVTYSCTAEDVLYYNVEAVTIGNKSIENLGDDTGEPFLIGYAPTMGLNVIETLDTSATHTVLIYGGILDNVLVDKNTMIAIADSIRSKTGKTDLILPADMATEIEGISGGGSDGSGAQGETFFTSLRYSSGAIEFGETLTTNLLLALPKEATDIQCYYKIVHKGMTSSGAQVGKTVRHSGFVKHDEIEIELETIYDVLRRYKFATCESTIDGAYAVQEDDADFLVSYRNPNVYIKENVLYGTADCTAASQYPMLRSIVNEMSPMYLKGVDLRGTAITVIPPQFYNKFTDLEFVYLPEGLEKIWSEFLYGCSGMKELHFTSETPPTVSAFPGDFPTTCTIYVPKGTLEAYKAAANYPDPTTYTYVEE